MMASIHDAMHIEVLEWRLQDIKSPVLFSDDNSDDYDIDGDMDAQCRGTDLTKHFSQIPVQVNII